MYGMTWPQAVCALGMFVVAGIALYVTAREEDDQGQEALRDEIDAMRPVVDAAFAWAARPDSDVESVDRLLDALYRYDEEAFRAN